MRLLTLLLSCYVLYLIMLPAIGDKPLLGSKSSCARCCPSKTPLTPQPKQSEAPVNPFEACGSCAQVTLFTLVYPFTAELLVVKQYFLVTQPLLIPPAFECWHPPKIG